jgi:hypothetical protein
VLQQRGQLDQFVDGWRVERCRLRRLFVRGFERVVERFFERWIADRVLQRRLVERILQRGSGGRRR